MKKLFKYEINESVAAKAAMNCVHKRLFKELYMGRPYTQEQVMNGEYDIDEWENDAYGNGAKRELVIQALVQAGLIQSEEEGKPLNSKIQEIMNNTNMPVTNAKEAEQFVNAYGEQIMGSQEQEEDGINKGGMHNLVQHGHIMNTPSIYDELEPDFSDLEEQEGYNMNFRAIAELVADQIDRENPEAKSIQNNMDAIFDIVKEVWRNNYDDLWIYDYDEVDEDACMEFFDTHYEDIKNKYFEKDKENIMDATHDDLFA